MTEIKSNMVNVSGSNKKILNSMSSHFKFSDDVFTATGMIKNKVELMINSLQNIVIQSKDSRISMEEINIGVNELYKTASFINEIGIKNTDNVNEIETQIDKFKTE